MNAGQTNLKVGTPITIINCKGDDADLNGLTGTITHPFAFGETSRFWVGVYLDDNSKYGDRLNLHLKNCKL